MPDAPAKHASSNHLLSCSRTPDGALVVQLAGEWKMEEALPSPSEVLDKLAPESRVAGIRFDSQGITGWDSGLLTFLRVILDRCHQDKVRVDTGGLPEGARRLLALAAAVPERAGARKQAARQSLLEQVGDSAVEFYNSAGEMLAFIGAASVAFLRLLIGKAQFRRADLLLVVQQAGYEALPIVSLINLLVGLILAFVGAVQLRLFGAQLYVANLVGIAMVRVMGAVMTGIIMAGRTGASFAAELGTMQVNEEIDALETLGISPMEFLVLPRMLALVFMMPLLVLYADFLGMLGGLIVGMIMLDLNFLEYFNQTIGAVGLKEVWIGLFHGVVFGVLIAVAGCMRGIQSGRSASGVGASTTSAVVTAIVSIVVATAIITVLCDVLGI
ncbi:MAG TPA: ABC transporter permease [Candidatus Methylomirabilis sp.]|nr:ABC transporter permease [Candidatus Methylomirabilis sp.]